MSGGNFAFEEWKDIPNYKGYYQASNLGRARSLDRAIIDSMGRSRVYKGKFLKGSVTNGYKQTALTKNNVGKTYKFSQLVAMAFLDHTPNGHTLVVDHIDGNKLNDRLENLSVVTQRENSSTCYRADRESFSSDFTGVCWHKRDSKWAVFIHYNGGRIYLGSFTDELEASKAYQSALSKMKDDSFNPNEYKPIWTSRYKGVSLHKRTGKWTARITVNGERKFLGYFSTEIEAHRAYQLWEEKPQDIF